MGKHLSRLTLQGEHVNIVSQEVAEFRPLQQSKQNADFEVHRFRHAALGHAMRLVRFYILGRNVVQPPVLEEGAHGLGDIALMAGIQNLDLPLFQVPSEGIVDTQSGERRHTTSRQLPLFGPRDQILLFLFGLSPVSGLKGLPDSLTVHRKIRVPDSSAFV
jgi:hypothetical protein